MNDDSRNLLLGLREMALWEIEQVEDSGVQATVPARALVAELPARLNAALARSLDTLTLTDDNLAPQMASATAARVGRRLAGAAREAAFDLGAELQLGAAHALSVEAQRLEAFALTCDTLLKYLRQSLIRPGALATEAANDSLAERLRRLRESYPGIEAVNRAPLRAGDLAAALAALEIVPALALPPAPTTGGATPRDLKQAYLAAAHNALNHVLPDALARGERAIVNAIAAEFRALVLELDAFLDAQWALVAALPASAFQAPPPVAAPGIYEPPVAPVAPASSCAQCGAPLPAGHRFCQVCGAVVIPAAAAAPANPPVVNAPDAAAFQPHIDAVFSARPGDARQNQAAASPDAAVAVAICPQCGEPLKPGHRFCGSCGATAAPAVAVCRKCGAALKPGERFCGSCGAAVAPAETPAAPQRPSAEPTMLHTPALLCPRCSAALKPDARVCPACGLMSPLAHEPEPAVAETPKRPVAPPPAPVVAEPCGRCGKPVPLGLAWCPECGARVERAAPAPEPAAPAPAKCYRCGAALKSGEKFCGSCGAPVPVRAVSPAPAPPPMPAPVCGSCGTPLKPDERFCGTCGTRVPG